jgi:hypothetical protein
VPLCSGDADLLELLIDDDSALVAGCAIGVGGTGSNVTPSALASAGGAGRELTESSFLAVDPGFGVSSARRGDASRKATAMVANIRAANFIVGS